MDIIITGAITGTSDDYICDILVLWEPELYTLQMPVLWGSTLSAYWGPISLTHFCAQIILYKKVTLLSSDCRPSHYKSCTCYNSTVVISWAKCCSNHFIGIWIKAKWNFSWIWIVMENMTEMGPLKCFGRRQWSTKQYKHLSVQKGTWIQILIYNK